MKSFPSIITFAVLLIAGCTPKTPAVVFPPTATVQETALTEVVPATSAPTLQPTGTAQPIEATRILQPVTIGSIRMVNSTHGMALGGEFGFKDHFLVTADGGYSWEDRTPSITSGDTEYPADLVAGYWGDEDVWLVSSFIDIAQPDSAVVYHSSNSGSDFTSGQPLDMQGLSETFYISQITFLDQMNGWLLAHVGAGMNHDYIAIYQTLDGGVTWRRILDPFTEDSVGIHSCSKDQMLFTEALQGWMTGTCNGVAPGVLLFQTWDGGISWEKVDLPDPVSQPGLFENQEAVCGSVSPGIDPSQNAFSITVSCGLFSADGSSSKHYRYTTDDLGQTWQSVEFPGGFWLTVDKDQVIAVGEEWQFSSDGGVTWGSAGNASDPVVQIQTTEDGSIFALTMNETRGEILFSADQGKSWKTILPGWE